MTPEQLARKRARDKAWKAAHPGYQAQKNRERERKYPALRKGKQPVPAETVLVFLDIDAYHRAIERHRAAFLSLDEPRDG